MSGSLHAAPGDAGDPISAGLFEASLDCIKLIDLQGRLLAMNVNGRRLMEIDDFEPLRGVTWATLWPETARATVTSAVNQAIGGAIARFSADCPTAKGEPKTWDVIVSPVFDAAGRPIQVVSISQDVTERRRALEQTALMSLELSHRIKNIFAVMDGVIALSARAEPAAAEFAETLRKRLHALGRATAYVSPSDAGGLHLPAIPNLRGLLQTLLEPYGAIAGPDAQLFIEGYDGPIGRSATTALALVMNELATNAVKYGALKTPLGRVRLEISLTSGDLELLWRETSEHQVRAENAAEGFGSSLLHDAVVRLLKGQLERRWLPGGLEVSIRVSAARLHH